MGMVELSRETDVSSTSDPVLGPRYRGRSPGLAAEPGPQLPDGSSQQLALKPRMIQKPTRLIEPLSLSFGKIHIKINKYITRSTGKAAGIKS